MKVVFLGWGSLIWNPNGLPLKGEWEKGGPVLPIEFSRISKDGRLTLVLDEANGVDVTARYALSSRTDVKDAIDDLRKREGTSRDFIGFVDLTNSKMNPNHSFITNRIRDWALKAGVDAVVWTALTTNFEQKTSQQFSVERAMTYLKGLNGTEREQAFDYICKTPEGVNTPLRNALMEAKITMQSSELEKEFDTAMFSIYTRAKKECGYNATRFLQMLSEIRGLLTAKHLLNAPNVSDGFTALWELNRLELTVEALVLQSKWKQLFSEHEFKTAKKRLEDLGYKIPK